MDFQGEIYSSACSTAEDRLSSQSYVMPDWLSEHSDYVDDSYFFESAVAETTKKSRKLADGSAASFTAKHTLYIKRKQAKRRSKQPGLYEDGEEDLKKHQQMIRNRISAQQSRDRRKAQLLTLEQENTQLRQQLSAIETDRAKLKSSLKKLRQSKLYTSLSSSSMTEASLLALSILVHSLQSTPSRALLHHSSGNDQNFREVVDQLGSQTDLEDIGGLSLLNRSVAIIEDLIEAFESAEC